MHKSHLFKGMHWKVPELWYSIGQPVAVHEKVCHITCAALKQQSLALWVGGGVGRVAMWRMATLLRLSPLRAEHQPRPRRRERPAHACPPLQQGGPPLPAAGTQCVCRASARLQAGRGSSDMSPPEEELWAWQDCIALCGLGIPHLRMSRVG